MREHVHVHGRHGLEHGGAMGLDAREHLDRIETRMQHERQSVHEGAVEDDVAVDVRARERRHDRIELRLQVHLRGEGAVEHDRTVGLHGALGVARRPRRVADGRERRRIGAYEFEALGVADERSKRRCALDRLVAEHDRLETRDPGAERRLDLLRTADQRLGATVLGHIDDLRRRQHDVDGIDDGTRLQHAVVADDPLPRIRRVERHAVARRDAEPHQARRECARQLVELGERERLVADHQRALVAKALGGAGQHLRERSEQGSSSEASRRLSRRRVYLRGPGR